MKIFVLKMKNIFFISSILVLAITVTFILYNYNKEDISSVNSLFKKIPIYSVETSEKKISLGFNAAWGNEDTDLLIKILDKYNVKVTFFVTGEWVDKFPDDVKKLYDNGHDIQNHSDKHPHVASISKDKLIDDTLECDSKIENLIGKKPTLYRAPYGEYDNDMMETFEKELGHKVIQWDVDSRDWKDDYTVDKIVKGVLDNIKSGSIVLFHNGAKNTPEALEIILEKVINNGYKIELIKDILVEGEYRIDRNGKMIKN